MRYRITRRETFVRTYEVEAGDAMAAASAVARDAGTLREETKEQQAVLDVAPASGAYVHVRAGDDRE